jgi:hypothetical protein
VLHHAFFCYFFNYESTVQIHDELVLEVDKSVLKDVANILRTCMEGAATLRGMKSTPQYLCPQKESSSEFRLLK